MKLISLFVLGVMAVAMSASAQAPTTDTIAKETTDPIEKALLAAPDSAMAKDAMVIKWNSDFTYETLKKGTNRMVCYDLSGWPGERGPFSVECTTSEANLPRIRRIDSSRSWGGATRKRLRSWLRPPGETERA